MNNWLRNYHLLVPSAIFFQTNLPSNVYILLYGNRILVNEGAFPWLSTADSFLLKITYRSNCPHDRVVFLMDDDTIPCSVSNDFDSTAFLFANIISSFVNCI